MNAPSPTLANILLGFGALLLIGGLPVGVGILGSFLNPDSRTRMERYVLKPALVLLWVALVVIEIWGHRWLAAAISFACGLFLWVPTPRFLRRKLSEPAVKSVDGTGRAP